MRRFIFPKYDQKEEARIQQELNEYFKNTNTMKVELTKPSEEKKFPFLAITIDRCDEQIPIVVCHEKDSEHYLVYFPKDNYQALQIKSKYDVTPLPSGSQIILTQP